MNLKGLFLVGSGLVVVAIATFMAISLRQAAMQAEGERQHEKAESECGVQVQHAIDLVIRRDESSGGSSRVTDTANHYNQLLHHCYVEVTTYEHGDSAIYIKTLISPADNSAVLWSVTGRKDAPGRHCFGVDAMPIDCATADKRWKSYMAD